MTSTRPSYHRSKSYSKWDNEMYNGIDQTSRAQQSQDSRARSQRPRSPSRVGQPYTSNCSRRMWPPSPKVEDLKVEEKVPMRGKPDQNPLIIDVPSATSSDSSSMTSQSESESSEPSTPSTSANENTDRRYMWEPHPRGPAVQVPIASSEKSRRSGSSRNTEKFEKHNLNTSAYSERSGIEKPSRQTSTADLQDKDRGRKAMPKIDTHIAREKSAAERPPPLERARSPYASGPQSRKPKADRFSGEYLLSPDAMSSRPGLSEGQRSQSHYIPRPAEDYGTSTQNQGKQTHDYSRQRPIDDRNADPHSHLGAVEARGNHRSEYIRSDPRHSTHPSLQRRASDMPHRPDEISANRMKLSREQLVPSARPDPERRSSELPYREHSMSSNQRPDSTVDEHVSSVRPFLDRSSSELPKSSSKQPNGSSWGPSKHPDVPPYQYDAEHAKLSDKAHVTLKSSNSHYRDVKKDDKRHSPESLNSPSRRSFTSADPVASPVNLSSLVNGAAITQTLNAVLNDDRTLRRMASPRPSPRASPTTTPRESPTTSPYSSPPRTPTSEGYPSRNHPVAALKKDSPKSRPSSPLSSRSSTFTADPGQPGYNNRDGRVRSEQHRPQRATPLATPHAENSDPMLAPEIAVRSPSPAAHIKPRFADSTGKYATSSVSGSAMPQIPSQTSKIQPRDFSERARTAPRTGMRPQLSVNPAPYVQPSEGASSSASHSRAPSPSVASPSERYKPTHLQSSPSIPTASTRLEPARPSRRSRSRSYVPEPDFPAPAPQSSGLDTTSATHRSRSSAPNPVSTAPAPRSSAPTQSIAAVQPMPLSSLPICPRPKRVAGYDDWYSLNYNSAFTVCPDCRDNVFGSNYEQVLQPRAISSGRKVQCDLNNPWVRLACLLKGPDIVLLSKLCDVSSQEHSCPEDEEAPRDWYRLEDPDTGKHIPNFNACPHCVYSLETIFPSWRDVFYRSNSSHHHEQKERVCSMRANGIRYGEYLDMVLESAREAEKNRRAPDTIPTSQLAKQLASISDCPRDSMLPRQAWHITSQIPEFTVCPACYEDVIYPMVKSGSSIASKFDKKPHQFPNPEVEVCCHLYSPRMRKVFKEACEDDDLEHLKHTALKRHMLQQDLRIALEDMKKYPDDKEAEELFNERWEEWQKKE